MVTWTTLCRVLVVEGEIPAGEKRQFNSVVAVAPGPAAPDTFRPQAAG